MPTFVPVRALRSPRVAAAILLVAAIAGLVVANSPAGPAVTGLRDAHLDLPWLGLELSVGHWITDGLLAIFFFLAAVELRHELTHGELDTARKALVPAVAAAGGVVLPAIIYLLVAPGPETQVGWPIPTATDIAFALGVLALAGRGLPSRVRALLLALAVIDDLIAILIIAFFFTADLQPLALLGAVPVVLVFAWLSARVRGRRWRVVLLVLLAVAAWALVHLSGVHATIAGVALGLVAAPRAAGPARDAIEPWSNGLILPLFAFVAALVAVPSGGLGSLPIVFWAVLIALPVGKFVGILVAATLTTRLTNRREAAPAIPIADLAVVASISGVGFTVSLLMNELAFEHDRALAAAGTLGVLCASGISAIVGAVVAALRARRYRRAR